MNFMGIGLWFQLFHLLPNKWTALTLNEKPSKEELQALASKIASLSEETFRKFVVKHSPQEQLLIFRLRHGIGVDLQAPNKPKHSLVQRLKEEGPSPVERAVESLMHLVDINQKKRLKHIFSKAGTWIDDTRLWLERLIVSQPSEKRVQALRSIAHFFDGLGSFTGDTHFFLTQMAGLLEQIPVEHWEAILTSRTNPLFLPKALELCLTLVPQYETQFGSLVDTISRAYGNFSDDVIEHTITIAKMLKTPSHISKVLQSLADCPANRREKVASASAQILSKLLEADHFPARIASCISVLPDEEVDVFATCFLPNDTRITAHAILSRLENHKGNNKLSVIKKIVELRNRDVKDMDLAKTLLVERIDTQGI